MIIIGNYSIEQYPKENKIVINLPQTLETLTTTAAAMEYRRMLLTENELAAILVAVKEMYDFGEILQNVKMPKLNKEIEK